jgi:2-oxoglutarate ferredoxin oxidoreductase subunit alpha
LPGSADATYDANSDEHLSDGTLTEEAEPTRQIYEKRLRKLTSLADTLPEPVLYGPTDADFSFVGWGSVKNTVLDVQAILARDGGPSVNYLHYEYLWPLKTETFRQVAARAKRLVLIENNALGQLGGQLTQATQIPFWERFLKYDGRPFFVEEVLDYVRKGAP